MKQKKQKQLSKEELSSYASILQKELEKVVNDIGFSLLEISFVREHEANYLRLTISNKERSITVNDCELVSNEVSRFLDQGDPVPFPYILEVQSPGNKSLRSSLQEHEFVLKDVNLVVRS